MRKAFWLLATCLLAGVLSVTVVRSAAAQSTGVQACWNNCAIGSDLLADGY